MGTIKKGILGGFSGKVGTVIGGSWKGIDYMRSVAASVTNPNTPAQQDQRSKFSKVIEFLKPLTALLRIGFKNQAVKMSGFNAAMSYTIQNAITGIYPAYEIDYAKAMVCEGTLPEALNPEAVSTVAATINFTWEDNSNEGGAKADDKAILVVYNAEKKRSMNVLGGNTRSSGSQTLTLPSSFSGDEVQCYIAFQNANQSLVSNSQFITSVVVL